MSMKYYDLDEFAAREVAPALGTYADEYDVEAIAREVARFDGHFFRLRLDLDEEKFWEIVEKHELPEGGAEC